MQNLFKIRLTPNFFPLFRFLLNQTEFLKTKFGPVEKEAEFWPTFGIRPNFRNLFVPYTESISTPCWDIWAVWGWTLLHSMYIWSKLSPPCSKPILLIWTYVPGQTLHGQISPWYLTSVKDGPKKVTLILFQIGSVTAEILLTLSSWW